MKSLGFALEFFSFLLSSALWSESQQHVYIQSLFYKSRKGDIFNCNCLQKTQKRQFSLDYNPIDKAACLLLGHMTLSGNN